MTNQAPDVASNDLINIEDIMRQIRSQILLEKMSNLPYGLAVDLGDDTQIPTEFYDLLYQATLVHEDMPVQVQVVPVNRFLIGPLLTWLKQKLHQFIVYYLNQAASRQFEANGRLLHRIALLSRAVAWQDQQEPKV